MPDISDEQLAALQAKADAGDSAAAALEKATADIETTRSEGVTALIEAQRAAHPDLPPDAIAGATIAEVNAAVTRATSIAEHVKANTPPPTQPNPAATAGQASAPVRGPAPAPEGLRALTRIRHGLESDSGPAPIAGGKDTPPPPATAKE